MPLPRWLTDFEPTHQSEVPSKLEFEQHQIKQPIRRESVNSDPTFLAQLKTCQSLDRIRGWATEHNVDLRKYSRLAFRQLVERARSLPALLQALEEPALDTPGNRNYFLERELRLPIAQKDAETLELWIKRQIALGVWSEMEILNVANLISQTPELVDNDDLKCSLAGSVFEGLQSSTVLRLQDVGDDIPRALLECVAQGSITRRPQALGVKILEALQPSQLRQMQDSISLFFQKSIRAQALQEFDMQEIRRLEAISRSLEVLRKLPHDVVHDTILKTSKALFDLRSDPSVSRQALIKLLDIWWSLLAKSSLAKTNLFDFTRQGTASSRSQRMLADQPLEFLVPYLRHFDDEGKARYVLRHWVVPALAPLEWKRAISRFFKLCQTRKDESPFSHVIQIAHDNSQLPDKRIQRLFRLLQMLQMSETLVDIIVSSQRYHVPISEASVLHTIRSHMESQPQMAERIFSSYPRLPLERCPNLAQKLILESNIHPNIPLEHYRSRKFRVAAEATNEEIEDIKQSRVHVLGKMALAYSKALHLTPRMTFRRIYRCYRCIISERLSPLPVDIVLAFVRSGIVRPLQRGEWVSTVKHRWILSLIRRIESLEDAEKVDELVYRWRGSIAKQGQQHRGYTGCFRPWLKQNNMEFTFRTQWSRRWSRYEKIVTPVKVPTIQHSLPIDD